MFPALLASVLVVTLPAQSPQSQQPRAAHRSVMPKELASALPIDPAQTRVVLKLAEQRPDLIADHRIVAADVLAVIGGRPTGPFFRGLEPQLAELRARQLRAAPAGTVPPVDLGLYFEVEAKDAADTRALVLQLNGLAAVELAYPRELPTPPPGDILPVTPDYTANQGYRAAPPNGLDGATMLATPGATGAGIRVLDIEWGWSFVHEDLSRVRASSLVGPPINNHSYDDHGTAVMGEICGDADTAGITGFTPDVSVFVATDYPSTGYSVAAAIAVGLPVLRAGDVMLLEAQTNTPLGLGPTEWVQADFDAILIATNLGVITVEAAGNGAVNLDSPSLGGLFDINVRDSGAIVVGASDGIALVRAGFSTYGNRIDANGWGYNVASTGYGDLATIGGDSRQSYTASFSGTSSASPMVTSAVLALRGAAEAQLDAAAAAALDAFAIRALLRTHGTQVPGGSIGRRPDSAALLAAAGVLTGLRVVGEPATGQTCSIQITPGFQAGPNDFFALSGGFAAVNLPMPAPYSGRVLVDPASSVPLMFATFATSPGQLSVTVPNDPSFRGLRYLVQGFTLVGATGAITATNSVQLFVRR
jgi:serine protease